MNDNIFNFTLQLIKSTSADNANRLVVLRNKLVEFATTPTSKKVLIDWYNENFAPLKDFKMTVGQQWSTVVKAFSLKDLSVEQKEEFFARQAKIDSSDTMKSKRLTCDALKATKE